ncbi:hypothetical protein V6N12_041069 [Hibiscus sabdariffa]|uniref:Carbohydrate kinase PfkB domain-containing protein n=1 Tax=Hibiscus sabdariffa TaxID=183260 RepID=A0ABR2E610_9ROSI
MEERHLPHLLQCHVRGFAYIILVVTFVIHCKKIPVELRLEDELTKDDFSGSKVTKEPCSFGFSFIQLSEFKLMVYLSLAVVGDEIWDIQFGSYSSSYNNCQTRGSLWNWPALRQPLQLLLESGDIDLCIANEDEATELLRWLLRSIFLICVDFRNFTCLGVKKMLILKLQSDICQNIADGLWLHAKHGQEVVHSQPYDMICLKTVKLWQAVRVPAIGEAKAVDATGAGDLFASGFLYGLVKRLSLEECCKVGSCSGGAVIRSLGAKVTPENWQWMYKQMQS